VGTITSGTISLTTDINTSGALKAGTVTYPNIHGTNGQVLSTTGSGTLSWTSIANPDLTNYVTTNTAQTITGAKTFSETTTFSKDLAVNGITVGRGGGNQNANTAIGASALSVNTEGNNNTAIGFGADVASTSLNNATAIGSGAVVAADNTIQLGADGTNNTTPISNVKTSGTITAGTVTYPNTHGTTPGQVLTTTGSGTLSWTTVSGGVPYTGATGAVNLGAYDLTVNEITVGKGGGNQSGNTAVGISALSNNSGGDGNTASGSSALFNNTEGNSNTASGWRALYLNTTGNNNTVSGSQALLFNADGISNTAIGYRAGRKIADDSGNNTTSDYSVYLGSETKASADDAQNEVVIGYNAIGAGTNTIQLGNTDVTNVNTSGTITAGKVTYPNTDGTTGQVLSTDGTGSLTWTTPATISIGAIAATSDPNGASISSGVLNSGGTKNNRWYLPGIGIGSDGGTVPHNPSSC
jgi:hypothetical protein